MFTVIAGVLVFGLSQVITYLRIKPHQAFLETAGKLSTAMLQFTARYTSFNLDYNDIAGIRSASAAYLATTWNFGICGRENG